MSSYEWVIEQESPDGVTTRIVLDLADDEAKSHGNSGRTSMSLSSHHPQHRRDGRGRGMGGGTVGTCGIFAFKEATRSEGGSSRRSSKRSNGTRSRRHCQQHLGSSGKGGAFLGGARGSESGSGTMAGPIVSAYTSAALRQRYQRVLFGGGRGGTAAAVARFARAPLTTQDASASMSTSGLASLNRAGPSASANGNTDYFSTSSPPATTAAGQPPNTVFMSAYGAEMGDEESQGSSGCHPCQCRCGAGRCSSSAASLKRSSAAGGMRASTQAHTTSGTYTSGGTVRHSPVQMSPPTTVTLVPPSTGNNRSGETRAVSDKHEELAGDVKLVTRNGSHYMPRDVWATRATCPRTISTARATDFPAFPPQLPISAEKEAGSTETVGESRRRPSDTADVCDGVACIVGAEAQNRAPFAPATCQEGGNQQAHTDVSENHPRYNKMLLKKERQRRRGRRWQPAVSSGDGTFASCKTSGSSASESNRGLCGGFSAGADRHGRRERFMAACSRSDACKLRVSGGSDADGDDADDESCDTSLSSLECLSTSSSDDFDVRQLRADSVFTATVQSLASRAERERKKMEAREEQMLRSEVAQTEEWLTTQRPPLHSQATLRGQLPLANAAAGGSMRNGEGNAKAGGNGAVSSFFISPIHQFVASESADWAAGTGFQFLGQGGLGSGETAAASLLSSSRPAQLQRRGCTLAPAQVTVGRRRSRPEDNEGAREEIDDACESAALLSATRGIGNDTQAVSRQARKKRKRGDCTRQSAVGECGGSRALRPVAAPSNGPPLEILPCSKKDMREDLLELFLMEAVLDEDDFQLC
ncbi:hypothetical protein GH5_02486 [Leishmania sp. Ghana 2012 LV757]|uniref:hypothetical protein n=1 Tax=Leishmania sp. Ghana 2012 LV757 TaxID=2803181 RepID=UPI001B6B6A4E|nr:hypothetical protein GH5_02486 [Leishmania sp. Ghana 2012 LV757]